MDFDDFLRTAWARHGDEPEAVAAQLDDALPQVTEAARVAPFAALAAHVLGEHLGRWPDAIALTERLRRRGVADADGLRVLDGHVLSLRLAAGEPVDLSPWSAPERAFALARAAALLTGRGDWPRAVDGYDRALAAAADGLPDGAPAARALAVAGNNLAAALEELPQRDASLNAAMLRAAEAALVWWRRAGTWLEEERAEYRLASSRLAAGQADGATQAAERCVALCERERAPALEHFFAQAVLARALHARGEVAAARRAADAARTAHAQVPSDEQPWCEADLAALPPSA